MRSRFWHGVLASETQCERSGQKAPRPLEHVRAELGCRKRRVSTQHSWSCDSWSCMCHVSCVMRHDSSRFAPPGTDETLETTGGSLFTNCSRNPKFSCGRPALHIWKCSGFWALRAHLLEPGALPCTVSPRSLFLMLDGAGCVLCGSACGACAQAPEPSSRGEVRLAYFVHVSDALPMPLGLVYRAVKRSV